MLNNDGKTTLAHAIQRSADMTVAEYSASLWEYRPQRNMEPALKEALVEEWEAQGLNKKTIESLLKQIEENRTIQTVAHTEITPPPRRFCMDWISTRALPKSQHYIIGAFSGVPFSNKSKPGRITFNKNGVNFIPKTLQNALAYETTIPEKTTTQWENLPEKLKEVFPQPHINQRFSHWAAQCAASSMTTILQHETAYFDINAVVQRYLLKVLPDTTHPMHHILLNPDWMKKILETFGENMHFFYTPYETGKYTKQENLYYLDGYGFKGDHQEFPHELDALMRGLEEKKLCPGTFLVFTALSFLNEFQCFGSFVQVEYLTNFKNMWNELGLLPHDISHVRTDSLTTGMFPADPQYQALDYILNNKKIPGEPGDLLKDYYLPIWQGGEFYTNKQT